MDKSRIKNDKSRIKKYFFPAESRMINQESITNKSRIKNNNQELRIKNQKLTPFPSVHSR